MKKKVVTGIMLTLLLLSMLTSIFNVQFSKAEGAKYIKSDVLGSVWVGTSWNKTYGGTSAEFAYGGVVQTSDGGYAVAGYTASLFVPSDFWLVKTDEAGNPQWNKTYGGANDDDAWSMAQTSDGGYVLAGGTESFGAGNWDFWLIKLTPATIYIRADGSVDPPTAPIQRNGNLYTLTDNIYTSATYGIVISRNNIIVDGSGHTLQGSRSGDGFWGYSLNNVTIKNTNIKNFSNGIALGDSWNNILSGNNMTKNYDGIYLYMSSNNNTISGNNMADNEGFGVVLYSSSNNNIISRNNITNNGGVLVQSSSNNNVVYGNTITNSSGYGVQIYSSSFNAISQNTITADALGVSLESSSSSNIVFGNNITNNTYGIISWYSPSNIISGNNITASTYYDIYLGESSNNSIGKNNIIASADDNIYLYSSVYLYYCSNTDISGNTITASTYASILLEWSSNNSISGNDKKANTYDGILLRNSSNNRIFGNDLTASTYAGIWLCTSSNNNTIFGNNITNNDCGVSVDKSSNNKLYHNNIIDNVHQVNSDNSTNVWDDGYPSGGNYWKDHNNTDNKRGQDQTQPGNDGIADTKYNITAANVDNYPLTKPYDGPHDIGMTIVTVSKTIIGQGFLLSVYVKILNYGIYDESFTVTVCADTVTIATQEIALTLRSFTAITFAWDTEGVAKGS
jgi:parallel beta-helix repeat protein